MTFRRYFLILAVVPLVSVFATMGFGMTARAAQPVAIVESISSRSSPMEAMDLLYLGDRIEIGEGGSVTLSYLSSCTVEQIFGAAAMITVGADQSTVDGSATVRRETIKCHSPNLKLSSGQAGQSAAVVFRRPPDKAIPSTIIYSRYPVFVIADKTATAVTVEANGTTEERYVLPLTSPRLDTATGIMDDAGRPFGGLQPGVVYRAKAGSWIATFQVDDTAGSKTDHLLDRLVGF